MVDISKNFLRLAAIQDPNFYHVRWKLGEALEAKGLYQEAATQYKKAIDLNDDPLPQALLGHLYARTGKEEAREILRELRLSSKQRYVAIYNLALIHIGRGENETAMDLLEESYEQRDGYNIAYIKIDSYLDPLRGQPRFEVLVQKVFDAQ